jgi:two-component system, OmpR family, response regulator VicR
MSGQEIQILYIEDERAPVDLVQQALKPLGYNITRAVSGQQALALMQQQRPNLVLLDLMMPDMNGWDVYRAMKNDETLAQIPVVVITARSSEYERMVIHDLPPAEDYIVKPFDVERVVTIVKKLLTAPTESA